MTIGDMVRRMVDEREPREPNDLLNGEHRACECRSCTSAKPIAEPKHLRNG